MEGAIIPLTKVPDVSEINNLTLSLQICVWILSVILATCVRCMTLGRHTVNPTVKISTPVRVEKSASLRLSTAVTSPVLVYSTVHSMAFNPYTIIKLTIIIIKFDV